jgi:hypothetical protein
MGTAGALLVSIAAQLLLGAAGWAFAAAVRRRWVEGWRALRPAMPWALGALVAGALLRMTGPEEPAAWVSPVAFVVVGAVPTAGILLLLAAGRLEGRGRLARARRLARRAGILTFAGVLAEIVMVWTDLLLRPGFRSEVLEGGAAFLAAGLLALGLAAFLAALAGLSGKPRPTGWFAALSYLGGLGCLAACAA